MKTTENKLKYIKRWKEEHSDRVKEQRKKHYFKHKDYYKEYLKRWRQKHSEYFKRYYQKNKRRISENRKEWYKKNPEKLKGCYEKYLKKWMQKQENREKHNRWHTRNLTERRKTDFKFRLDSNMGNLIRQCLKDKKAGRRWEGLVGYTIDKLIKHLESLFDENMNWDNYGKYEEGKFKWHIDHIKPKSLFYYKDAENIEFKQCWALENLQPLEAIANIKKGNKVN